MSYPPKWLRRRQAADLEIRLPDQVDLAAHDAPDGFAFRLGKALDAHGTTEWVWWDPDSTDPHMLATGATRSGKSVLMRALLSQAIAGGWDCVLADPQGVDYRWVNGLPGVRRWSGDDAFEGLDWAVSEMKARQVWMEEHAPREATNLSDAPGNPFAPCLVIAEGTFWPPDGEHVSGDRREMMTAALAALARRARFVNIVLAVTTQRPDRHVIPGEMRVNLGTSVLMGEGDVGLKAEAFGARVRDLPPLSNGYPPGRGRVAFGGSEPREFQAAWIDRKTVLNAHEPPDAPSKAA